MRKGAIGEKQPPAEGGREVTPGADVSDSLRPWPSSGDGEPATGAQAQSETGRWGNGRGGPAAMTDLFGHLA